MANTYTKNYVDGSALTEAMLDTAYQSLQLDIANTALASTGSSSGQALISNGSGIAASFQTIPDPQGPFALRNYGLRCTAASGVLVISLRTKALAVPSGSDVVNFNYSTNGTTSASYSTVNITSAVTFSLNASATLGYTPTSTIRIYTYGYYNTAAAAVKLAVSLRSDLDVGGIVAATAVNAAADNESVLYATSSLNVVPRLLGWIEAAHNSSYEWQTPTKVNITNNEGGYRSIIASDTCGTFTTTSSSFVGVTNLSKEVYTNGGPVLLMLIGNGNNRGAINGNGTSDIQFLRDGVTEVSQYRQGISGSSEIPSCISALDFPSAGLHTYTVRLALVTGSTVSVLNSRLVAIPL